jgi:hypothetical protein
MHVQRSWLVGWLVVATYKRIKENKLYIYMENKMKNSEMWKIKNTGTQREPKPYPRLRRHNQKKKSKLSLYISLVSLVGDFL